MPLVIGKKISIGMSRRGGSVLSKAIVFGIDGVNNGIHDEGMRMFFLNTCQSGWECHRAIFGVTGEPSGNIVTYQPDVDSCIDFAIDNGYEVIIFAYQGASGISRVKFKEAYANGLLLFCGHASNTHAEYFVTDSILSYAVLCGAVADDGKNNETSYGQGVEFIESTPSAASQSVACATIAGKFAYIRNLGYTRDEARQVLRQITGTYVDGYSTLNGYGRPYLDNLALITSLDVAEPCDVEFEVNGDFLTARFTPNGNYDVAFLEIDGTLNQFPTGETEYTFENVSGLSTLFNVGILKNYQEVDSLYAEYSKAAVTISPFKVASAIATNIHDILVTFTKEYDEVNSVLTEFYSDFTIIGRAKVSSTSIRLTVEEDLSYYIPTSFFYQGTGFKSIFNENLETFDNFEVDTSALAIEGDPTFNSVEVVSVGSTSVHIRVDVGIYEEATLTVFYGISSFSDGNFEPVTLAESGTVDLYSGLVSLVPDTTYKFRVLIQSGFAELYSNEMTFTTNA